MTAENDYAITDGLQTIAINDLLGKINIRYPAKPTLALVIGTFAAVPYIHLHLESRRRHYPNVPVLVHDDCSPKADELRALCREYGAEYEMNAPRLPPCKGDLAAFAGGLKWAERRGTDILVKMSRRFVPVSDWSGALVELATQSQYPSFCSHTDTYDYGFRSECVGMGVRAWVDGGGVAEIAQAIISPGTPFVEGFLHQISRRLSIGNGAIAKSYDDKIGERPTDKDGYAVWPFMGTDRARRWPGFLWHDAASIADYAAVARQWGLGYGVDDFADANQGFGAYP